MLRKHLYRLWTMASLVVIAVTGTVTPVMAEPGAVARASIGANNSSGKTGPDGKPLTRDPARKMARPKKAQATWEAECPPELRCIVVPAAYQNNNPADPVDYGNYDTANRPHDMAINSVVIHDTEGTLQEVLDAFRDPMFYVSSHYVIDTDGTVYQMVQNKNVAWHAGNWHYNMHSIGIEHIGHAALGHAEFTHDMYEASAKLVKWLASRYNIPRDRQHIMGSDNVPARNGASIRGMHIDPGPFWNWQLYMSLLGEPVLPSAGWDSDVIAVAPVWPWHKPVVTGCWPAERPSCVPAGPPKPASIVYLRTAADKSAPLISDLVLGQGTTDIGNTAATAYYGQEFVVNQRKVVRDGIWYQVWFSGQLGWLFSPWLAPTAFPAASQTFTPRSGLASIPVYGRPLPEQSEYPADFVPPPGAIPYPSPWPYTIAAGQRYTVVGGSVRTDHYYAWTYNSSLPYDHTVFVGNTAYLRIQFNGRQAFVKASDVVLA